MIPLPCIDRCDECKGEHHWGQLHGLLKGCTHCALIVAACDDCGGNGLAPMRVSGGDIVEDDCEACGGLGLVAAS